MKNKKRFWLLLPSILLLWIVFDLFVPHKSDFRHFNPSKLGKLDSDMWRSYYERKSARLFFQLAHTVREQFHAPFWRSFPIAFKAAKAAFVFKDGTNRKEYALALPLLEDYFRGLSELTTEHFDVKKVAERELEWWIIRREPQYTTDDWQQILKEVSAAVYHQPEEDFASYAQLRVEAMKLRDEKGEAITNQDWTNITRLLEESWTSLYQAVNK